MAIQLLRHRPRAFTYAVVLSGFVIAGEEPGDKELTEVRPPVFWGRGTRDPVIPESRIEQAASWLPEHSSLTSRTYAIGHSITEPELADVSAFITTRL
jgi:phospholipase/carboxylesterase